MKKMKGLLLLFIGSLAVLVLLATSWMASAGVATPVGAPGIAWTRANSTNRLIIGNEHT